MKPETRNSVSQKQRSGLPLTSYPLPGLYYPRHRLVPSRAAMQPA